jgi:ribosomal protein L37AE/L43A
MGYSKEQERQNQVLGDLLSGREPEKRVMVGYDKKKEKSGDKISRLSDVMKEARMPMFCPECDRVMKKRLDNKFWRMMGHCFDCQIKIEHKLRLEGKYDEWEKNKIKQNKIAFLKEQIQAIEEWRDMKAPEFFNNVGVNHPELQKEKWGGDMTQLNTMAEEALEEYTKTLNKLEKS